MKRAALLVACRSVWVHPEATAEKYADDLFFCQRGLERSEWRKDQEGVTQSDRSWALETAAEPAGEIRRGWKRCMVNLGWDTTPEFRSSPPSRRPRPPARYGPKRS